MNCLGGIFYSNPTLCQAGCGMLPCAMQQLPQYCCVISAGIVKTCEDEKYFSVKSDCDSTCSFPFSCSLLTNQYCCTINPDGNDVVSNAINTTTKIAIGCGVGGGILLILAIIGCYYCCCRPRKGQAQTMVIQNQPNMMQPVMYQQQLPGAVQYQSQPIYGQKQLQ
ncbi:Hypothetical_protein [Hexamita inflata]|uniref:Hypothetical_protein n=1 Tax=Hexamita inflata TaxID=28002 RepID=A0AA86TLT9_9EUKA|nr:Hypothetical protein HINF_LOCUS7187 [Hexamita inflata]